LTSALLIVPPPTHRVADASAVLLDIWLRVALTAQTSALDWAAGGEAQSNVAWAMLESLTQEFE